MVAGTVVGVLVLMLAGSWLAAFSLNFTPIEYFALGVFALLIVINLIMVATGALGARLFTQVLRIPEPLLIAMVLSPMIEQSLRQGLVLTRGNFLAFFERPIATVLFIVTAGILLWPLLRRWRGRQE